MRAMLAVIGVLLAIAVIGELKLSGPLVAVPVLVLAVAFFWRTLVRASRLVERRRDRDAYVDTMSERDAAGGGR